MNILAKKIEGILFFESEAISLSELVSLTADSEDNIKQALIEINEHYKSEDKNRTIRILWLLSGQPEKLF